MLNTMGQVVMTITTQLSADEYALPQMQAPGFEAYVVHIQLPDRRLFKNGCCAVVE